MSTLPCPLISACINIDNDPGVRIPNSIVIVILESIKIILDCQIINEDTLLGLELQHITPFEFHFRKLWISNYVRQILSPQTLFDINLILTLTQMDVSNLLIDHCNRMILIVSFDRTLPICI